MNNVASVDISGSRWHNLVSLLRPNVFASMAYRFMPVEIPYAATLSRATLILRFDSWWMPKFTGVIGSNYLREYIKVGLHHR